MSKLEHNVLTEDQLASYHENGFLVISELYTELERSSFLSAIRRHANADFAAILNPDREEELLVSDERPKSDITLEEISQTSTMCQKIISNPKTISSLRQIQNKDIVFLSSQMIFKEAGSNYASQAWRPHQDNRYIDNENGQYITVNWFLRDSSPSNGGIYAYPGSHKLPILPAPDVKSFREKPGTNPGRECQIPKEFVDKKLDLHLSAGDVVILHGNCIHGSYANNSGRSRPWYSACYITEGEYFNVGRNSKRIPITFP